jgi:hypothetical protein
MRRKMLAASTVGASIDLLKWSASQAIVGAGIIVKISGEYSGTIIVYAGWD